MEAWGSVNGLWKDHYASKGYCQNWIQFHSNTVTKCYGRFWAQTLHIVKDKIIIPKAL